MRTREEQIAAAFPNGDTGLALMYQGDFTIHILEAERRAEQRVRAEIGKPVYQFKSGVSYWTDTTEVFYKARVLEGQEVRKLYRAEDIDAARGKR